MKPQITTRVGGNLKQYETEVATPELVGTLLSDLGRHCSVMISSLSTEYCIVPGIESSSEVAQEIISRYSVKKQSIISIAFSILAHQG